MQNHQQQQGSVLGSILLIAGCCIGAAMLGLPIVTAPGGFPPTFLLFVISWLFTVGAALLLLEVNLWFTEEASIVSMAGRTLGKSGKFLGTVLFGLLFFSLMAAYVGGSGQFLSEFAQESLAIAFPSWVGSLVISCFFGIILYLGTQAVDRINRLLMLGLIATYCMLITMGSVHVNVTNLARANWGVAIYALPVTIVSFGYHNLIPSLSTYLNHDVRKLRFVIFIGSAVPLVIYLFWEFVILGLIPFEGAGGFCEALARGDSVVCALRASVGSSWIVSLANYFAFFAIVTSFLSVALSFVDFLADGLHIKKTAKGKALLCLLCLAPPFFFGILNPQIFLDALSYAGVIFAVLFGILPALMVWSGRYVKKLSHQPLVAGGKLTLIVVILFSLIIVALEIYRRIL